MKLHVSTEWNLWNDGFRAGYRKADPSKKNPGDKVSADPTERGRWWGWNWKIKGRELPDDPASHILRTWKTFFNNEEKG